MFAQIRNFSVCFALLIVFLGLGACDTTAAAVAVPNATTPDTPAAASTIDLWVDPVHGDNSRDGATRSTALRTITAAWQRIPAGVSLPSAGYRILLVAGDYTADDYPIYWEDRHGTANYPIRIEAADGARTARPDGWEVSDHVDQLGQASSM